MKETQTNTRLVRHRLKSHKNWLVMEVHADVLRMVKTEEERERIKWFYARRVLLSGKDKRLREGLELARQSEHPDARFLVSLFPEGQPWTVAEAVAVFLSRSDDARCLCWAAELGGPARAEVRQGAALPGYTPAQWLVCTLKYAPLLLLEQAVADGDAYAMTLLASRLWREEEEEDSVDEEDDVVDVASDNLRAEVLWRQAALLGDPSAQIALAERCCEKDSNERFMWARRSAMQGDYRAMSCLLGWAGKQLERFESGASGANVFQIGMAFRGKSSWSSCCPDADFRDRGRRAIELYKKWLREARTSVLCWVWCAQQLEVGKDMRLLIARLVWEDRAVWSERPRV